VTGPAGIGKSSLVASVQQLTRGNARWVAGRGDVLRGNVPHAPLIEALSGLVEAVSDEPEETLSSLRERLQQATSPNGRVLVDAIPDLRALLGDPAPVPVVGAPEEENRFRLAFAAFIRAFLANGPPLVVFLDDLQWLDAASLGLVRAIAVDPD